MVVKMKFIRNLKTMMKSTDPITKPVAETVAESVTNQDIMKELDDHNVGKFFAVFWPKPCIYLFIGLSCRRYFLMILMKILMRLRLNFYDAKKAELQQIDFYGIGLQKMLVL